MYRREKNLLYYESNYKIGDSVRRAWYAPNTAPEGYHLYLKKSADTMYLGGTARPGEHLELYPVWSYKQSQNTST